MIKIILIFFAIVFGLSGCVGSDYTEPENRALITALIIELSDEYKVTAEIINVESNSDEKTNDSVYLTGKGNTLSEALADIQNNYSKKLSLYHCPLILCQKDIYNNDLKQINKFVFDNAQISLAANLVIIENLDNFIEFARESEETLGYEIIEQIELKGIETKIIDILNNKTTPASLIIDNKEVLVVKNE